MAEEKQVYTVADYESYIGMPENQDRLFELIDGDIVKKWLRRNTAFSRANSSPS